MNIPFYKNYFSDKDIDYTRRVIERGMHWANGPEIQEFEKRIAQLSNQKYCLVFNSGTSALFGILSALNVKSAEVIVPSFTFIASANTILHAGGKPVFADIETKSFGLDYRDVERKISKKTKAIMVVHYGGCACDIEPLRKIAGKYKLYLIEDAAEAIGSEYKDQPIGSFGVAAMFSFTPTKVISTGEGGAVVTNSKAIFENLKLFRSHGRLETEDYFTTIKPMDYIALGYNFRMPTIIAAQGLAQLDNLKKMIEKRRKIAQEYQRHLGDIKDITINEVDPYKFHTYQLFTIIVNSGRKKRNSLQRWLKDKGITAKIYFEPIHKTHFYKKILKYDCRLPITETLSDRVLSLPIYPSLATGEQNYIIHTVRDYFRTSV